MPADASPGPSTSVSSFTPTFATTASPAVTAPAASAAASTAPAGKLIFTVQAYPVDPATRGIEAFDVPRGGGPYGVAVTP